MDQKNSGQDKRFVSLGISLSVLCAALFFFSFFVIIWVLVTQHSQNSRSQLRIYGETVVENLVQAVELSDKNEDWLQAYVVAAATNPGLLQVTIADRDGFMIVHSNPRKRGERFPAAAGFQGRLQPVDSFIVDDSSNVEPFFRFVAPVSLFSGTGAAEGGLVLVDVALSGKVIDFTAGKSIGFLLGLLALFALTISTLYLFLNQRVVTIVKRLTRRARRVASGNFSERIIVGRNDELGQLAASFNLMAKTLGETTVSRDFFDKILHSMGDALIVLDPDLQIVTANQAALTLLGYEEKELVGKNMSDIVEREEQTIDEHPCRQEDKPFNEMIYIAKDGHRIPVLTSRAFIERESGAEDRGAIVCIAKDITERIQAEQDICQINANLTEANKKLQQTQAQLIQSAKLASLGEMAAGIAHELNQPLHIIGMSAEIGSSYLQMEKFDNIGTRLEKISQQVKRATTIINHLRTFGRETSGLEQSDHDVNRIIEDTFILFNEQLRVCGIEIRKNLGRELPRVSCNPIQIEQVLSNLLGNAKDALKESAEKTIILTSRVEEKSVLIEVRDTGVGMDQMVQKKIFDPFFTTKEVGKGTGLGLSISYGIINDHGGTLEVESEPGKGSLFRIQLPVAEENK